jgi:hypothetical protein
MVGEELGATDVDAEVEGGCRAGGGGYEGKGG